MYSLVLMTAMTTTPSTLEFGGFFRDLFAFRGCSGCVGCSGCGGCTGGLGARYACSGGCGGCVGYSGCCGGETFRERLRRLFGRSNCSGCCGGCAGYPLASGCCGGLVMPPIIYNTPGSVPPPPPPTLPYAPPEAAPPPPPAPILGDRGNVRPAAGLTADRPHTARGTVIVRLPDDARLYAQDRFLPLQGHERQFVTPPLPPGQDYTYRFRIEYEREGETISISKQVKVRPGQTSAVEFGDWGTARPSPKPAPGLPKSPTVATSAVLSSKRAIPSVMPEAGPGERPLQEGAVIEEPKPLPATTVEAAPAREESSPAASSSLGEGARAVLTIHIPVGATLSVDGQVVPTSGPVATFRTPPLPAGREFRYQIKADLQRQGRAESVSQSVTFRAGDRLTIHLGDLAP